MVQVHEGMMEAESKEKLADQLKSIMDPKMKELQQMFIWAGVKAGFLIGFITGAIFIGFIWGWCR